MTFTLSSVPFRYKSQSTIYVQRAWLEDNKTLISHAIFLLQLIPNITALLACAMLH